MWNSCFFCEFCNSSPSIDLIKKRFFKIYYIICNPVEIIKQDRWLVIRVSFISLWRNISWDHYRQLCAIRSNFLQIAWSIYSLQGDRINNWGIWITHSSCIMTNKQWRSPKGCSMSLLLKLTVALILRLGQKVVRGVNNCDPCYHRQPAQGDACGGLRLRTPWRYSASDERCRNYKFDFKSYYFYSSLLTPNSRWNHPLNAFASPKQPKTNS